MGLEPDISKEKKQDITQVNGKTLFPMEMVCFISEIMKLILAGFIKARPTILKASICFLMETG